MPTRSAEFVTGSRGRLYVARWAPAFHPRSRGEKAVILPPFGEEMNKSRRVMSRLADALAAEGLEAIVIDLYGTGDSEGDFGDSRLEIWQDDIAQCLRELGPDIHLVGLRFGALLAADAAAKLPCRSLTLVQPVIDGDQQLTQLFRLVLAGEIGGASAQSISGTTNTRFTAGEDLEIGGYRIAARLRESMTCLTLGDCVLRQGLKVNWLELGTEGNRPRPAQQRVLDAWNQNGIQTTFSAVIGPRFWTAQETVDCPELIERAVTLITI